MIYYSIYINHLSLFKEFKMQKLSLENIYKVEIKSREELVKIGFENNYDLFDFINLLPSKIVTIVEKSKDGKILICKEFPDYAIYDVAVKNRIEITPIKYNLDLKELTLTELSNIFKLTPQRISAICKTALKKISKIAEPNKDELVWLMNNIK